MFSRFKGTEMVKEGTYLCLTSGEFVNVAASEGRLPGTERAQYLAVNPLVALLVGPIAGLMFVIFLPLAVPMLIVWLVVRRVRGAAPAVASQVADSLGGQGRRVAYAAGGEPSGQLSQSPIAHGQQSGAERPPVEKLLAEIDDLLADMEGKPERKTEQE